MYVIKNFSLSDKETDIFEIIYERQYLQKYLLKSFKQQFEAFSEQNKRHFDLQMMFLSPVATKKMIIQIAHLIIVT